jgi:enamine deaminase RidA (YjgF/YER057c/UK114 family)
MTFQPINPSELSKPAGFSHAVVTGDRRRVYLAGQTALDRDGRITGSTLPEQFEQALTNLLTALAAAGGRPDEIASMTIYLTDIDDYRAQTKQIGAVWRRLLGRHFPAVAAVGVTRLWDQEAMVEVQAVAEIDGADGEETEPAG